MLKYTYALWNVLFELMDVCWEQLISIFLVIIKRKYCYYFKKKKSKYPHMPVTAELWRVERGESLWFSGHQPYPRFNKRIRHEVTDRPPAVPLYSLKHTQTHESGGKHTQESSLMTFHISFVWSTFSALVLL